MVKDIFSYSARWDSVGLNCGMCNFFVGPSTWPDANKSSRCRFHDVSLSIELDDLGYLNGEWFCKHFTVGEQPFFPAALHEFTLLQPILDENKLYRASAQENLFEIEINRLRRDNLSETKY